MSQSEKLSERWALDYILVRTNAHYYNNVPSKFLPLQT